MKTKKLTKDEIETFRKLLQVKECKYMNEWHIENPQILWLQDADLILMALEDPKFPQIAINKFKNKKSKKYRYNRNTELLDIAKCSLTVLKHIAERDREIKAKNFRQAFVEQILRTKLNDSMKKIKNSTMTEAIREVAIY